MEDDDDDSNEHTGTEPEGSDLGTAAVTRDVQEEQERDGRCRPCQVQRLEPVGSQHVVDVEIDLVLDRCEAVVTPVVTILCFGIFIHEES